MNGFGSEVAHKVVQQQASLPITSCREGCGVYIGQSVQAACLGRTSRMILVDRIRLETLFDNTIVPSQRLRHPLNGSYNEEKDYYNP